MSETEETKSAKVIALDAKATLQSERKWGRAVMKLGFSILPSLIFRAQARLGINATELAILLHLADFWWDHSRKPYPKLKTLGDRLNLSSRQVARYIDGLKKAGLVKTTPRHKIGVGQISNEYDL